MKQKNETLLNYQTAIEFVEYFSICLESGHTIQKSFFLSTKHISEGHFQTHCLRVIKHYELGRSFQEALYLEVVSAPNSLESQIFENIRTSVLLGTQLTKIMKEINIQVRLLLNSKLEELAQKAPIKMIFPLVFFIFPVLFTLLCTKTFLNFFQSLGA